MKIIFNSDEKVLNLDCQNETVFSYHIIRINFSGEFSEVTDFGRLSNQQGFLRNSLREQGKARAKLPW